MTCPACGRTGARRLTRLAAETWCCEFCAPVIRSGPRAPHFRETLVPASEAPPGFGPITKADKNEWLDQSHHEWYTDEKGNRTTRTCIRKREMTRVIIPMGA